MSSETISVTTPAGRTLKLDLNTLRAMEAAAVEAGQIDTDIDALVGGRVSAAGLLAFCQMGADEPDDWQNYVDECVYVADNEMTRR